MTGTGSDTALLRRCECCAEMRALTYNATNENGVTRVMCRECCVTVGLTPWVVATGSVGTFTVTAAELDRIEELAGGTNTTKGAQVCGVIDRIRGRGRA